MIIFFTTLRVVYFPAFEAISAWVGVFPAMFFVILISAFRPILAGDGFVSVLPAMLRVVYFPAIKSMPT